MESREVERILLTPLEPHSVIVKDRCGVCPFSLATALDSWTSRGLVMSVCVGSSPVSTLP